MASIKTFWTETAIRQRNFIFDYWIERNGSNSYPIKLNKRIKERINQIKTNPKIGRLTNYKSTRILYLGHYSILYQLKNNTIIITGFWDNRQDPKKLLNFLKKL